MRCDWATGDWRHLEQTYDECDAVLRGLSERAGYA